MLWKIVQPVTLVSAVPFRFADRNAAINILNRGNTPGVEIPKYGIDEARTFQVA